MLWLASLGWQLPHFAITSGSAIGIPGSRSIEGTGWAEARAVSKAQLKITSPGFVRDVLVTSLHCQPTEQVGDGQGRTRSHARTLESITHRGVSEQAADVCVS
jgi:hypothetical protein